ncbi:hypothetical protein FO519_009068, partial [Halicephalobus sp. NKZ332]
MILNRDIYHDLIQEVIILTSRNPELTSKLMFSGEEPLDTLKKVVCKIRKVYFYYVTDVPSFFDRLILYWDKDFYVYRGFRHPFTRYILRWALSSVKEVEIWSCEPLPAYITEFLLRTPNTPKLDLYWCDVSTTKLLLESRRFGYVKLGGYSCPDLNDIHLNIEELEYINLPLNKILASESIKTNSLIITDFRNDFNSLFTMNISPNFQSVKRITSEVKDTNLLSCVQSIPEFLRFLTTRLVNVKYFTLNFTECECKPLEFDIQMKPTTPLSFFKDLMSYGDGSITFDKRVKVKLNYSSKFVVKSNSQNVVDNYVEKLKKELQGFEYSSDTNKNIIHYNFKKLSTVAENFE